MSGFIDGPNDDESAHPPSIIMRATPKSLSRVAAALGATLAGGILMTSIMRTFSSRSTIEPDLSTYVLPAVERARGFGALYVDFLDIKPPLTFGIFLPWFAAVGNSLVGLWVLYLILIGALLVAFWLALRMQLAPWLALGVFLSCIVVVTQSGMFDWFFFTTEVVGLVPLLWGLVIARRFGHRLPALFFASLMLTLAGQAKDVFVLVPLALIPLVWHHRRRALAVASSLAGIAAAFLGIVAMLTWWGPGTLRSYVAVLGIKREIFPFPGFVEAAASVWDDVLVVQSWLPLLALLFIALGLCAIYVRRESLPESPRARVMWRVTWPEWMYLTAFFCVALGFAWQGRELSQYYAIAFAFPLFIALSVPVSRISAAATSLAGYRRPMVITILAVSLVPTLSFALNFAGMTKAMRPWQDASRIISTETPESLSSYSAIRGLAIDKGCLHVAYGWGASAYYLYTGLKPCTRFMAPPLAATTTALALELREAIVKSPPSVLVMDPTQRIPFDDESGRTENVLLPFDVIADTCYLPSPVAPNVYVPLGSESQERTCIEAVLGTGAAVHSN